MPDGYVWRGMPSRVKLSEVMGIWDALYDRGIEDLEFPDLLAVIGRVGIVVEEDRSLSNLTDRSLYPTEAVPDSFVLLYTDVPQAYRHLARPKWDDGRLREFIMGYRPRCRAAVFAHSKLNGMPKWDRFSQCDYPAWDDSLRCYLHREGRVVDLSTYQREFLGRTLPENVE
jgi:hypothetical protein